MLDVIPPRALDHMGDGGLGDLVPGRQSVVGLSPGVPATDGQDDLLGERRRSVLLSSGALLRETSPCGTHRTGPCTWPTPRRALKQTTTTLDATPSDRGLHGRPPCRCPTRIERRDHALLSRPPCGWLPTFVGIRAAHRGPCTAWCPPLYRTLVRGAGVEPASLATTLFESVAFAVCQPRSNPHSFRNSVLSGALFLFRQAGM